MDREIIKYLEQSLKGVENDPEVIKTLEQDPIIKDYLKEFFDGVVDVKYSYIQSLSNNDLVTKIIFNYAQDHVNVIDDDKLAEQGSNDALSLFIKDISRFKLLSREEELKLTKAIKNGRGKKRQQAREELINHNYRLVISMAFKYKGRGVELVDLIQEGSRGLMTAVEKFDPDLGNRFSTYATPWIRQSITRYIADHNSTIRKPVHRYEMIGKLKKIENEYRNEKSKTPTAESLARFIVKHHYEEFSTESERELLKGSPLLPETKRKNYKDGKYIGKGKAKKYKKERIIAVGKEKYDLNFRKDCNRYKYNQCYDLVKGLLEDSKKISSINAELRPNRDEEGNQLSDFIADPNQKNNPEYSYELNEMRAFAHEVLNSEDLMPREREIIRLRFGMGITKPIPEEEIYEVLLVREDRKKARASRSKEQIKKDIEKVKKVSKVFNENKEDVQNLSLEEIIEALDKSKLSLYEKELFELLYGIPVLSSTSKTLEDIGEVFDLTKERIRQLERRGMVKLSKNIQYKKRSKDYIL